METKKNILSLQEFQKIIPFIEETSDSFKDILLEKMNKMFNIREEDNIISWWFEVKDKSDFYKTILVEGNKSYVINTSEDLYNFLVKFYV